MKLLFSARAFPSIFLASYQSSRLKGDPKYYFKGRNFRERNFHNFAIFCRIVMLYAHEIFDLVAFEKVNSLKKSFFPLKKLSPKPSKFIIFFDIKNMRFVLQTRIYVLNMYVLKMKFFIFRFTVNLSKKFFVMIHFNMVLYDCW